MLNLEGSLPVAELDDMYVILIRRANLDAIAGRATTTIGSAQSVVDRLGDGGSILRQLLRIPNGVAGLSERMARGVLRMPGDRKVSDELNGRHVRKHLVQSGKA